jgi:hypothetical protein
VLFEYIEVVVLFVVTLSIFVAPKPDHFFEHLLEKHFFQLPIFPLLLVRAFFWQL